MTECNVTEEFASIPICCSGGQGTVLGGGRPLPGTDEFSPVGLAIIYLVFLAWTFVGVALAADAFMSAIEYITSLESTVMRSLPDGTVRRFRARTWNPTVANLTLMALGSSAPEILLSVIELFSGSFYSGELGPSTIVGSAAFNLLVIIAICVVAIPADDRRRIEQPRVYAITAVSSTLAYLWLVVILLGTTPDVVDLPEAILTFLFFPLLVGTAYIADKVSDSSWRARHPLLASACCAGGVEEDEQDAHLKKVLLSLTGPDGSPPDRADVVKTLKQLKHANDDAELRADEVLTLMSAKLQAAQKPKSRAFYRVHAVRSLTGGAAPTHKNQLLVISPAEVELTSSTSAPLPEGASSIGFAAVKYSVIEGGGSITVQVNRSGACDSAASVAYRTEDLTATAGSDYVSASGTLTFGVGESTATISVTILDDDVEEDDEQFLIILSAPAAGEVSLKPGRDVAHVTIINDDFPGTFVFPTEEIKVKESAGTVRIQVDRVKGCSGEVSLQYSTRDGTALAGTNYTEASGTLTWAHGDVNSKFIEVAITDDDMLNGLRHFDVVIDQATGGALFDKTTDGKNTCSLSRVTIQDDEVVSTLADRAIAFLGISQQSAKLGKETWHEQFVAAVTIGGGEDGGSAGPLAWAMHLIALPWKLLVACVPPTVFCGGWLCFVVAIILIGGLTALIGDLASLLGCALGIEKSVVAITLVALGTSLPDTFASKAAACGDETADAAIGNVTGSNSVNVFLGLGLSWCVGAIYWSLTPATAEWIARYPKLVDMYGVVEGGRLPGLAVPSGDLSFSVTVFVACSLCCLGTLSLRRVLFGAELGGKMRWPTFALYVSLWLLYIALSTLKAYAVI